MTELQQFVAMLERAGIGHGTRDDHNPPGTSVQVESEEPCPNCVPTSSPERDDFRGCSLCRGGFRLAVAEFGFDSDGKLKEVVCYPGGR